MRLSEILAHLPDAELRGDGPVNIAAVHFDSRSVGPESIFVAVPGFHVDGHDFIGRAAYVGCSALCVQRDREPKWRDFEGRLPLLVVDDTRAALATIAAALNGFAARRLNVIAVTGTDGKTSLSYLLTHILQTAGERAGLLSTADCRIGDEIIGDSGRFTTPEAPEVQSMLATMAARRCRWAVVEATSHGLALHRLDHIEPDIAAVTNVTADHLDFHGSVENYIAAKGLLFEMLDAGTPKPGLAKTAVLNSDDAAAGFFRERTNARILTYGIDSDAGFRAVSITPTDWGSSFTVKHQGYDLPASVSFPGVFNVYNVLAAIAVSYAADIDLDTAIGAIRLWTGAPGRMQRVDEGQPFTVVVDFAHAPDSLRRVLSLLRSGTPGRLIAVFGCIGERERERRAGMGRVAAELADFTIVTDDNPYTEDRDAILAGIAGALRAAGKQEGADFAVIPDRRDAIAHALRIAQPNDAVLLAGKGHETKVVLDDTSYECNDAEVARRILRDQA
jgi:UDP-N-acetylmuramoyl-L-alanyl-D-glutamate--2,6-diaminopimelate ligase